MRELAYASTTEIGRLVRTHEVSPVEIVDYFLGRISQRNQSLNAFVFVDTEGARKRARAAEKALYSGGALGPLHGVPAALKDLFDYRPGWVNTLGGIRAFAQHRSDQYSVFAQRVEESGAIMLGGTNAPTFGFRGTCDNYLFGPTKTPFNLKMNSGGLRFHAKIPPSGREPSCLAAKNLLADRVISRSARSLSESRGSNCRAGR